MRPNQTKNKEPQAKPKDPADDPGDPNPPPPRTGRKEGNLGKAKCTHGPRGHNVQKTSKSHKQTTHEAPPARPTKPQLKGPTGKQQTQTSPEKKGTAAEEQQPNTRTKVAEKHTRTEGATTTEEKIKPPPGPVTRTAPEAQKQAGGEKPTKLQAEGSRTNNKTERKREQTRQRCPRRDDSTRHQRTVSEQPRRVG
ncbi:basic salivary proline-rich protein 4-like [Procambarus clarkii]|uniref:basic salivary proline-rich protein 4-like n=1 Tax=Procambarus clarkii TaxID=6728 RepID=UPI003742DECA